MYVCISGVPQTPFFLQISFFSFRRVLERKARWSKNAKRVRRQTFFFILTFQVLNFKNSTKEIRYHNIQFMIEF